MKKILIIGKNGFVSKSINEYLMPLQKYDICVISSEDLDLFDECAVKDYLESKYYDYIIDGAVWSPLKASLNDTGRESYYDMKMYFNIAKYNNLFGKLIYFGSGAEYDKRYPIVSVSETDFNRLIPVNDYGFAKYVINQHIETSRNIYNLRIFGLYGKYENYRYKFITGACAKAVLGLPITIRKNVYFDFLYIDDFCKMIDMFIELDNPMHHSYNVVSGKKIDLISLAAMIKDVAKEIDNTDIPIHICNTGLSNEYTASNTRLIEEIGNVDITSHKDAIRYLYNYFKEIKGEIDIEALLYQK